MKGIDISNWQQHCIPSNIAIDFCICKATEGINFVDQFCDGFIQDCIEHDILWGFYHFARENTPEEEAEFFYDNCKGYIGNGIPVLDYEVENYNNAEWCERFITKFYELSGIWCMIYISAYRCSEYSNSWIPEKCGLWVAGYPYDNSEWINEDIPYNISPWNFAAIWQFTSSLILNGFVGKLDGDIAYMDKNAWMKYAGKNKETEIPETSQDIIDALAYRVINGEFGNGKERRKRLGSDYERVQKRIEVLYKVAGDVIKGKYGNGKTREKKLKEKGYPYKIVQFIVNNILG